MHGEIGDDHKIQQPVARQIGAAEKAVVTRVVNLQ